MASERFKPAPPGRRVAGRDTGEDLTVDKPHKPLLASFGKKSAGRNSQGKITVRHRGGGHKRLYRALDFLQDKFDIPATVATVEYDPNRSGRIGLLHYADGQKTYTLLPDGVKVGDIIICSKNKIELKTGNRLPLKFIPVGMMVCSVELEPGKGGELARSAGAGITVMAVEETRVLIKMPSGEQRYLPAECLATVGQVSNLEKRNIRLGKAGRKRWLGIRPSVRGKAMNPIDHPHGGGEGNQPIGLKGPKTPSGKWALGVKTRRSHRRSDSMIVRRRRRKK